MTLLTKCIFSCTFVSSPEVYHLDSLGPVFYKCQVTVSSILLSEMYSPSMILFKSA